MKKTEIKESDFRASMKYCNITLQDFASFTGFSLDTIRSVSCERYKMSVIMYRLINALLDQQEATGTNDCKRHSLGEIK